MRIGGFPEDSTIYKTISNVFEKYDPNRNLSLKDIKIIKNKIFDKVSVGAKTGSKYYEIDDQAVNIFLKNHGEYIGDISPELKQLNSEFAPMANARAWAMKTFRPYNELEIQKGADILERLAKNQVPNQTDLNYLKVLAEGSGRFKGANELRGITTETGKKLLLQKEEFDLARKNLIDATNYRINQLQNQMAELRARKIDLTMQREQFQNLIKLRNKIIVATVLVIGAETIYKKAKIFNPLD